MDDVRVTVAGRLSGSAADDARPTAGARHRACAGTRNEPDGRETSVALGHDRSCPVVASTWPGTLAAAGVLDGRPATTHWRSSDLFAARHPRVRLQPDVLFVDDGDVLTAAGSAATLDLGQHLIRRDHGVEIATVVSRRLVFAAHRDGGQRQFVAQPIPAVPDTSLDRSSRTRKGRA